MTEELRGLSAALNRVGNNVNQVARRLNEAKLKRERLPYTPASHAEIRDLAVLVFDMADQIQEMFRARRRGVRRDRLSCRRRRRADDRNAAARGRAL